MSDSALIEELAEQVQQLEIETRVLKALMQQQIALNNISFKGKYDEVIIRMAQEYEALGLDEGDNRALSETLRGYLRDKDGESAE